MSTQPPRPAWRMPLGLPQATDDSWAYVLDDTGVVYGPGWWPFYTDRSSPQARWSTGATPQPCGVRLAPDVAFYAWHTEYLALYPTDEPGVVDGACHVVPSDTSRHDTERTAFRLRMVGDGWTAEPIGSLPHSQDILSEKTHSARGHARSTSCAPQSPNATAEPSSQPPPPTCTRPNTKRRLPARTRPHPQPKPDPPVHHVHPQRTGTSRRRRGPRSRTHPDGGRSCPHRTRKRTPRPASR
jgi:hypothetical protein